MHTDADRCVINIWFIFVLIFHFSSNGLRSCIEYRISPLYPILYASAMVYVRMYAVDYNFIHQSIWFFNSNIGQKKKTRKISRCRCRAIMRTRCTILVLRICEFLRFLALRITMEARSQYNCGPSNIHRLEWRCVRVWVVRPSNACGICSIVAGRMRIQNDCHFLSAMNKQWTNYSDP